MNYFSNMIRTPVLIQSFKKFCVDLLQERYTTHEGVVNKLSKTIETDEDYVALANLISELYESGYVRSVEDHQKVLKQHNINIHLKRLDPNEKKPEVSTIFPQEKSG